MFVFQQLGDKLSFYVAWRGAWHRGKSKVDLSRYTPSRDSLFPRNHRANLVPFPASCAMGGCTIKTILIKTKIFF